MEFGAVFLAGLLPVSEKPQVLRYSLPRAPGGLSEVKAHFSCGVVALLAVVGVVLGYGVVAVVAAADGVVAAAVVVGLLPVLVGVVVGLLTDHTLHLVVDVIQGIPLPFIQKQTGQVSLLHPPWRQYQGSFSTRESATVLPGRSMYRSLGIFIALVSLSSWF